MLILLIGLWACWWSYWFYAARSASPPRFGYPGASWPYMTGLVLCDALLLLPIHLPFAFAMPMIGLGLVAAGLGIAVWARRHLGASWAGSLSIQHQHQLIRSGPYAWVRHPIYTGLLIAFAGTGLFIGELTSLAAPLFAFLAFRYKLRIEEQQLRCIFPDYDEYMRVTPALLPVRRTARPSL